MNKKIVKKMLSDLDSEIRSLVSSGLGFDKHELCEGLNRTGKYIAKASENGDIDVEIINPVKEIEVRFSVCPSQANKKGV